MMPQAEMEKPRRKLPEGIIWLEKNGSSTVFLDDRNRPSAWWKMKTNARVRVPKPAQNGDQQIDVVTCLEKNGGGDDNAFAFESREWGWQELSERGKRARRSYQMPRAQVSFWLCGRGTEDLDHLVQECGILEMASWRTLTGRNIDGSWDPGELVAFLELYPVQELMMERRTD